MVSDLRGFTALSSRMEPSDVLQVVNRFLGPMVDIITRYRGTIDDFQGDGILAFFGAPLAAVDDPERAVACAVEMQRALVEINAEQRKRGLPELHMGIGIDTGEVIVGNIGSEKRTKYGALGTPINIAYRVESHSVSGQVLISQGTYERVKDVVRVGHSWDLHFKGLDEQIEVYEVNGLDGKYACSMPERTPEQFLDLDPPLPIECFILEGKTVSNRAISGRIVRLSENCAEGVLQRAVDKDADLMIRMVSGGVSVAEAYAKVMEADAASGDGATRIVLNFTSLPDDAKAFLEKKRTMALRA